MVSQQIKDYLERSSWIRKMFEEGIKLKKTHGEDRVLDLTLGNPDLPPPPRVKETLQKIIENYEPSFHRYMPNAGFPFVREVMAKKVSIEQGVTLTSEDIIMTCGAAGALNIIFKTLLNPGEEVIFPSPFFVEYLFYTENHQGIPKPVSTNPDFSLNLEALDQNITEKTKIVLINSPNNPTGQIYTEEEIKSLAKLLSEKSKIFGHPIYLVSDEPYRNLVFDNHQVPSIFKHYPNSLIAYSFSKELSLAGERIGFVAVHPEIQPKKLILEGLILCNRILGFVNAPALAQRLAAECAFAKVETIIYQRRRDLICEMLEEAGLEFVKPKGGLFIFPKVPMDDVTFCQKLKEHLILAVPGRGFGVSNHIRLSFCVDEETLKRHKSSFIEAVKTILNQA
ncbi:pyridoxal phosphate-dependent aminotransferase [Thermodesulfobacterium sp.]|jgi:aspartate aminotransferase|uniref:pyridoxal phosphate-dependent aminotransferase n=1 Tax=Thermodesulfobacterium sp. TaxID=1965289 RepID=UPI0007471A6A|nr:pyridoxal phosphate-dependent aminotransferase [Thermodesulfobacterium sp.]KUJ97225.1 MAG: Aspartate transaminase [Thermodesulfobacterium sp. 37_54]KUK18825.1 MAG: Aspartate transaminase [Thermodesulfobacterium commune]KUK38700.1 MAG: Aspartate transaminase [Thermodesulfobacterium commune]MBZ4682047.1 aspartate aminotransferase [Thermodesulfobacterium sp.]MDK2862130.1 aspartate aminotransferase [Thermodesulfobacterium sp.]